ncbi:MAG TPA: hypothetical protein VL860_07290 [Planctomycetota bacterium]|nr:hypothetical protein [Planctomycetota bacterium]
MQLRSMLAVVAGLAVCCALILVSGCGSEPAPAPAAAGSMAGMHHDADAAAPAAATPVALPTKAFMCPHCGTTSVKAAECPTCHMAMTETAVANPDPMRCPVTGEKIDAPVLVVVAGKLYDCCDTDCLDILKKDPAKCLADFPANAEKAKQEGK